MKCNSSVAISALVLMATGSVISAGAYGQQWPAKPVRIIVPFAPGQAADIISRLIAERLTSVFGQQILVDNRPGAGSMIGAELAAKSPPDGYTFLAGGASALAINPHLYSKLGYDTLRDFAPVTNMTAMAMVFCVNPALPAKNIADLIKLAKERPGELTFASSGNGSVAHLAPALLSTMTDVKMTHVPYKGSIPAITDLIAGQIAVAAETMPTVLPHVKAGKIRAIGVTTAKRSPFLPDVATLQEQGIQGFEMMAWTALVAPMGTPALILDRMSVEVAKAIHTSDLQKRIQELALSPIADTREHFDAFLKSELVKWGRAVKASGAKVE